MARIEDIDKARVVDALSAQLTSALEAATASQQTTQAGATHEEARPEGDKDTRATEQSYLARGLAVRVAELREAVQLVDRLEPRRFEAGAAVGPAALVTVEDENGGLKSYFIAPAGGGLLLDVDGVAIRVITPKSPLARLLIGRSAGDEVEQRRGGEVRVLTIAEVA